MPKVKVAIMGCGGMAGAHARRLKPNPHVQIVGLTDVDVPRVQAFIDRHLADYDPKPAIFTDAARMYSDAKPDAVVIVTPHTLHFEHGMLSTWDVLEERFGWALVWGDLALVPLFYSLPGWYLVDRLVPMSALAVVGLVTMYALGFWLFRGANQQKHRFKLDPAARIWRRPAETIGGRRPVLALSAGRIQLQLVLIDDEAHPREHRGDEASETAEWHGFRVRLPVEEFGREPFEDAACDRRLGVEFGDERVGGGMHETLLEFRHGGRPSRAGTARQSLAKCKLSMSL